MESPIRRKRKRENKINGSLERPAKCRNGLKCSFDNCFLGEMSNPKSVHAMYYQETKKEMAKALFWYYNYTIFQGKLVPNIDIIWNPRIWNRAGITVPLDFPGVGRFARIELSTAMIDSPERLRDVMAHEVCHVAAYFLHGIKQGHGPIFQEYARRARKQHPELRPITVFHRYWLRKPKYAVHRL